METESQASFSIGKETGELAVMETIRMDDMDFFEMVHHFFNREREVIQNPLAPERGAAPEALPQAPAPTEVAHPAPDQKERERAAVRALSGNDGNLVQCREGDNVLRSGDLRGDGYGNPPQMDREYKGDPNLLKPVIREYRPNESTTRELQIKNFTSNFGPQHPAAHGVFTSLFGKNEKWCERAEPHIWNHSQCGTKRYAESAPMPLAMPCLVPRHGGGSRSANGHEHRAKGRWPRYPHLRSDEWRTDRPGFSRALAGSGVPVKGASAYPGVIITTCTSNLGTVERVTRLLFHSTTFVPVIHSLTERSSEGQPAHTASGEDGTTGKDRLAKTPQARSVVGLRRGSIGRKGSPRWKSLGGRTIGQKWKALDYEPIKRPYGVKGRRSNAE
ncbi:hypothetical protein Tco_0803716 [Tanacetum coccineum]|uniref:NADH dehydrogenase subunit 7 n=1 Tax=Tanacetum coccineum TaxID=301880 RepID=A0ABQ5A3Z8_9ASTR